MILQLLRPNFLLLILRALQIGLDRSAGANQLRSVVGCCFHNN